MKTSTVILIAVAGVAGIYLVSRLTSTTLPRTAPRPATSSTASSIGQFFGGLVGSVSGFISHGATSSSPSLSAGDKQIIDTVTDKDTGAVDLSGVYDTGPADVVGGG